MRQVFGPTKIGSIASPGNGQIAPLPPPPFSTTTSVPGNRPGPFTAFPHHVSRASLDASTDRWMLISTRCMKNCTDNRIVIFPTSETFLKHLAFLLAKADIMVTD